MPKLFEQTGTSATFYDHPAPTGDRAPKIETEAPTVSDAQKIGRAYLDLVEVYQPRIVDLKQHVGDRQLDGQAVATRLDDESNMKETWSRTTLYQPGTKEPIEQTAVTISGSEGNQRLLVEEDNVTLLEQTPAMAKRNAWRTADSEAKEAAIFSILGRTSDVISTTAMRGVVERRRADEHAKALLEVHYFGAEQKPGFSGSYKV